MKQIKKFNLSGIVTLALYINDSWIMDLEVSSQFSEKEIRQFYNSY